MRLWIIKTVLWFCGMIVLLTGTTRVLLPKWLRGDMKTPPYTEIIEGFYNEPEKSLDVVFIGSSHIYCDVNPLYLWNNYGITSYDFSMAGQTMDNSFYYMQETFKTQCPKIVFLEVWRYEAEYDMSENGNRQAYDYMPNSVEKWQALGNLFQNQPNERREHGITYLFPIMRYHSRFSQLTKKDFTYMVSDKHNEMHGFYPKRWIYNEFDSFFTKSGKEIVPSEHFIKYVSKMKRLCEKKGAELILMASPVPAWTVEDYQAVSSVAEDLGLRYLDLNHDANVVEIDIATDFADAGHTNVYGADKVTKYIGDFLKNNFDFLDHRGGIAVYQIWDEDYQYYMDYIKSLPVEYQ